jgi:hypothetical protein
MSTAPNYLLRFICASGLIIVMAAFLPLSLLDESRETLAAGNGERLVYMDSKSAGGRPEARFAEEHDSASAGRTSPRISSAAASAPNSNWVTQNADLASALQLAPRLLSRHRAATYCNLSPSALSAWVRSGKLPPSLPGTTRWDRARAGVRGLTFHDLRGSAVVRLELAEATVPQIATFTGHSLKDVEAILDAH